MITTIASCHSLAFVTLLLLLLLPLSTDSLPPVLQQDSCYKDRGGTFPCSSTITGNVILMFCYGGVLAVAAKCIADGAEMLLDLGLSPGLIGGVVLPFLGAVPDAAIIIASGLGDDAQEKMSVGMGTLAGSTVMLLTVAWSASLFVGNCDLNEKDEAVDKKCTGELSLSKRGVTLLPDIKINVTIMLATSSFYLIVQCADWYWGATLTRNQPSYVKNAAFVTMIMCVLGLIFYMAFSLFDSHSNERLVRLHQEELLKRKVIQAMVMQTNTGDKGGTNSDGTPTPVVKKYIKAWRVATGSRENREKMGLMNEDTGDENTSPANNESTNSQDNEKVGCVFRCACQLGGGFLLVTVFSDPMCDVLVALTNTHNSSYIPVPSFYVSFIVTPLCSNASELVSSLIFASKKTKDTTTMTFAQLFGAGTMNNTLCLAVFTAMVFFKDLEWIYGAEVICILAAEWIVGLISYTKTYKIWMGIPVAATYMFCLSLVWLLEYKAGWH